MDRLLLLYLAMATDRELARYFQNLKAENRIVRGKLPNRITVTLQERRRLLRFGKGSGAGDPHPDYDRHTADLCPMGEHRTASGSACDDLNSGSTINARRSSRLDPANRQ